MRIKSYNASLGHLGPYSPRSIHQYFIERSPRGHRVENAVRRVPYVGGVLSWLVKEIDYPAQHPLEIVFSIWGLLFFCNGYNQWGKILSPGGSSLKIFSNAVTASLQFLAWGVVSVLSVSNIYRLVCGPKKPDYSPYSDYFHHLKNLPVSTLEADKWEREAITFPTTPKQYNYFIHFHSGIIAWLDSFGHREAIEHIRKAVRNKFPLHLDDENHALIHDLDFDTGFAASTSETRIQAREQGIGEQEHREIRPVNRSRLSHHLTSVVARLRSAPMGLNAHERPVEILKNLLSQWLKTNEDALEVNSGIELTILLKPALYTQQQERWEYFLQRNAVNAQAFKTFSVANQVRMLQALYSTNDAGKLTALSLVHDTKNFSQKERRKLLRAYVTYTRRQFVDHVLEDEMYWFLDKSDRDLYLEVLAPLLGNDYQDSESALSVLFRLVANDDTWPDAFLKSFDALYRQLSSNGQVAIREHYSGYRGQDTNLRETLAEKRMQSEDIEKSFRRLGVTLLIATHRHTKPKAATEKETAIMLDYVMPKRKEAGYLGDVFLWDDVWEAYSSVFTDTGYKDTWLSISKSYIYHRFLNVESNEAYKAVAMILLGAYRQPVGVDETNSFDEIMEAIIDNDKMTDVLKALMEAIYNKMGPEVSEVELFAYIERLQPVAEAFIKVLLKKENFALSSQEAAWLCHLHGCGTNIVSSVINLYQTFGEKSSWEQINKFQRALLQKALEYVHEDPEGIVPYVFSDTLRVRFIDGKYKLLPSQKLDDVNNEESIARRIIGGHASFISELHDQEIKPSSQRSPLLVALYYQRLFDLVVEISQDSWGEQENLSEEASVRGLILNPIVDVIRETGNEPVACRIVYFLFSALLKSPKITLQSRCDYFHNIIAAYNNTYLEKESLTDVLIELNSPARENDDYPYSALELVIGWAHFLMQYALQNQSNETSNTEAMGLALEILCSCANDEWTWPTSPTEFLLNLPRANIVALLLYNLSSPEQASGAVTLFQNPPNLVGGKVSDILIAFGYSSSLEDAKDVVQQLKIFKMDDARLAQLIKQTEKQGDNKLSTSLVMD